jgi:hypothetical protein
VWVTADALLALAGKAFPLRPVARVKRARRGAASGPGAGARHGKHPSGSAGGSGSAGNGGAGTGGSAGGGHDKLGPPTPGTAQASAGTRGPAAAASGGGGPSTGLLLGLTGAGLLIAAAAVWLFRRRLGRPAAPS